MKRSSDFLLRTVAGKQVLVPVGAAAVAFPGMVNVNSTGSYLWQLLEQEQTLDSLVISVTDKYDVSRETAEADIEKFVNKLRTIQAIIE